MDETAIPVRGEDLLVRVIDGHTFVMDATRGQLHELNEVGARIFELVDGRNSVRDIVECIVAEYDVAPDKAAADVSVFLETLEQRSLIVRR